MANKNYTLSDILGAPISKHEALTLIKQNTDSDTFRAFNLMDDAYREKLLRFIMGKNGLAITYNPVFLIVFMEKSPAIFHETDQYMHQKHTLFDTGIKLNLLDNITFISLDTFKSVVHNINTKREAWLKFLTEDDPDEIVKFVNQYPEFLPCYHDLIAFRQNPKEMINMFSYALRELHTWQVPLFLCHIISIQNHYFSIPAV